MVLHDKTPHCPQRNCNIMKLLPLLLDINTNEEIDISPSQLMHELQMSCEERLEKLCKPTRKHRILTESNTFSRTPDIVVFQKFIPGMTYTTTLSLLNLHPVSRHVRVIMPSSPFFRIKACAGDNSAKVAPGMSFGLNITFLPLEDRDYIYKLMIVTEQETFDIPLYALGHRPLLHLPDHISLPSTAVKLTSEKSMIAHNTDEKPFNYLIHSKTPFGTVPSKGIIKPSTMAEIKIFCKSSWLGLMKGCFYFCYLDIKLKITVECEVESANIYLEKDHMIFEEIFMGLKTQETLIIHNRSNHLIDFQWKLHKTHAIDQSESAKLIRNFENIRELEKRRCNKLETMNITDYEGHSSICDRTFEDEVKELETNNLYLYKNPNFDIIPLTGQVLPNQKLTFIVIFSPTKNEDYESWAYLEVKGIHDRLPLNLRGVGKGPRVVFNVKVLNINEVFLCAPHYYEIVVKNEGNIPATVLFNENVTDFGGTITCDRKKISLEAQDSCGAFIINFYSKIQGKFIERVEFIVKESEEIMHVIITGNVICPMLKLNIQEIDFGIVPFGYERKQEFLLTNDSQVPIDFYLKINGNNEMSHDNDDECSEIQFNPKKGNVNAYSYHTVQVQLTTREVKLFSRHLNVNMWGSKTYSVSIPIKYNCMCPKIHCIPDLVHIKFCFLNYECIRNIKLVNESIVPGFIAYTPTNSLDDSSDILCTPNKTEFTILPHEEIDIELKIITTTLGLHKFPLIFTLSGSKPMQLCMILCNGQGPVVSYKPEELRFGHILLLHNITKELTLMNDSPIPAKIRISTPPQSKFQVDIHEVEIAPEAELSIPVNAYLTDNGKYTGVVNIIIEHGENISINVFGEGVGYSIQCEPVLKPEYDARALLTYQEFVLPVVFTNLGKKYYKVRWSRHKTIKSLKTAKPYEAESHFTMVPEYFEISSNESKTFEIHGYSEVPDMIEEDFYCHALIGKATKIEVIMSFTMKADFVEPAIDIVKPDLSVMLANDCEILEDDIVFHNDTDVALTINFQTSSDYYIVMNDQDTTEICQEIASKGVFTSKIKYAPHLEEKKYFKNAGEFTLNYENHPNQVKLCLSTEVCFPTVELIPGEIDFNCIPLNSHSYKKVIIRNITFLPVTYRWELFESFEAEEIPKTEDEDCPILNISDSSSESSLSEEVNKSTLEMVDVAPISNNEHITEDIEHLSFTWKKDQYVGEMKKILLPIFAQFMEDTDNSDMTKNIKDNKNSKSYKIKDIITIEPFQGHLEPFEYSVAIIGFFPRPNMKIKAEALCKVEDGEQETLVIRGISSKLAYLVNKEYVEFGRRLFCEICVEEIILTNNGYCDFDFKIVCDDYNEELLQSGWLNVSPSIMTLSPGVAVTLKISYFPGITGEFNRKFCIEIGYLEPLKIKFHGYAVFSQIYFNLPRPSIQELPLNVLYKSISTLSVEYLQSMKHKSSKIFAYHHISGPPSDISAPLYKQLRRDGWVVISKNDIYPSKMDIDLSVERILVRQHVIENEGILKNHTFTHKIKTIPEFSTDSYIINFGSVVREVPVCFTALLLNYGPIRTDVILLTKKNNTLEKNGFRIEFKNKKLSIGEVAELYVIFTPKLKKYPGLDTKVEDSFCIIARHGADIPIIIRAMVTMPRLLFENSCIDFGAVKLGNCIRRSVLMTNDGSVESKWSAEIEMVEKRKKIVYFLKQSRGKLLPKKKQLINIYFMPTCKGFKPARLIIHIEGNSDDYLLHLCGYCTVSTLVFNHTDLKFQSALPYSQDNSMKLMVQNVSTAPLEFSFIDFDEQYEEEKLWSEMYLNYNTSRRVFIPQRVAGEKLHRVFQDNYILCLNELRQKLIQIHMSDADETETIEDPLVEFSQKEIVQLLNEFIETGVMGKQIPKETKQTILFEKENTFFANTAVIEPDSKIPYDPKGPQSAIFMIFHGGLDTEYLKASNRAGIILSIPVYSIDRLIYGALVANKSTFANEINTLINNTFDIVATEEDLIPIPDEDEYDILTRKVYVVLHNKPPKPKKGSGSGKKSKAGSDKSSEAKSTKGKKEKEMDTLLDIPVELFSDMLQIELYTFTHGLIIESLNSEFLRKNIIALECLLRAIGNAKYVHVIILSYNIQDYLREEEEKLKEEARQKQELENKLKEDLNMSPETTQKTPASSRTDKSSKSGKSNKSKKEKPPNYAKQILKSIPKPLKIELEAFQAFVHEISHICEFWDKRNCTLIKPFNNPKANTASKAKSEGKTSAKDSVKDSKPATRKGKERKSSLAETRDSVNIEDLGITLWLINNSNKERPIDFPELTCQSLKSSWEIKKAKEDIKESLKEHLEECSVNFSIIKRSKQRNKITSDLFIICNGEPVPEKNFNEVFAISTPSLQGRNVEQNISSSSSEDRHSVNNFTPRCVLQPEKIFQYEFRFYPRKCGLYNCTFEVEVIGLNLTFPIQCQGRCELPRIDFTPEMVFPRIVENYRDKSIYDNFVYIKEEALFDFGLIILSRNMPLIYETNLLLKNMSRMCCEVVAELSNSSQYFLKSKKLIIEPGHEENLTVSIRVTKTDYIYSDLYISIKNNPKTEIIRLVTSPCKLEFSVKPKMIIFDKVPLNYTAKRQLTLTNSSPINLQWKFVDGEWASEIYTISETNNCLVPFSMGNVLFEYTTSKQEIQPKRQLEIQVFDMNHSTDIPVFIDFITLQADSVVYNLNYNDHIDLGEIQGKKEYNVIFNLDNEGNCPVCVGFSIIDNPVDTWEFVRNCFLLKFQEEIVLNPNKSFQGALIFKPTKSMDFKEVPILLCRILEPGDKTNVINSFVFKVSANVFLSSFEMCPASDVYFGYQQILTTKKQTMDIVNTGKFTFSYTIVSLKRDQQLKFKKEGKGKDKGKGKGKAGSKASSKKSKDKSSSKKSKKTKSSDKKTKSSKSSKKSKKSKTSTPKEKKKIKITKLNVEGFCITSSTGYVDPNETVQVQIECTPQEEKEYKEIIVVYVSEPQKKDTSGRYVTLHVTGCESHLNFNDFNKIFKEQFIVDKMENFIKPKNIGSHQVFVSSEITLHFKNVCINTTNVTKIYLENTGHVQAHVTATIADTSRNIFAVFPSTIDIHPYNTEAISIAFTPTSIEEFENKLEITYNSSKQNQFILSLSGEGVIPQIILLEPIIEENNQGVIEFIPTYVGQTRSETISFKNVGLIFCKVIIEICENFKDMFSLVACDDTFDLLNISDLEEFQNTKYSTLVNLQPDQTANFNLIFKPTCDECINMDIKIHTVNNPFEIIKLAIQARGYCHDIYLELTPCDEKIISNSSFKSNNNNCIGYHIDFGFSVLNYLQKKYFTIRNNSEKDVYRFEFSLFNRLIFVPRVGHLKPLACKEIIVTFSTRIPHCFDKVMLQCNLNKIEYIYEEEMELLSWDDRQRFVSWENMSANSSEEVLSEMTKTLDTGEGSLTNCESKQFEDRSKGIDNRTEPDAFLIPDTADMIPLFFSIIADYSSYTCKICIIDFPDTFIRMKNEVKFDVDNIGLIPLDITWDFCNEEVLPIRASSAKYTCTKDFLSNDSENGTSKSSASSTTLFSSDYSCSCSTETAVCPFTILPEEVSIYPNQCQQFSVYFKPMNMAQYCVRLKSNISGLDPGQNNIDIKVLGTSFLPVCYFDIEESDYLDRRPENIQKCVNNDYVDVKIIEFEAVGIGVSTKKTFNLINPTEEIISYEFESEEDSRFSYFTCKTKSGFIMEEKQAEIVFTFKSQELGHFEEYYMCYILGKDFKTPLLLAGHCRQPIIYFTKSYVVMKPTILMSKMTATAILRNEEDEELSFKFSKESLFNENHDQQLEVSPMCGKISPNSDLNIRLTYLAQKIGKANFYLKCAIEKVKSALSLNVTASCLEVLPRITYTDKEGKTLLLEKDKENVINLENVFLQQCDTIQFTVSNIGEIGFFYRWSFNKKPIEHLFDVSINREKDFVPSNNKSFVIMSLTALKYATLPLFKPKINISYGPTYILDIRAVAEKPSYNFSFSNYNFGCCIVQKRKTDYYNVVLEFKNGGKKRLVLENYFENSKDLTVDFKSAQVSPSSSQNILIFFHPLEVGQYKINIPFTINSVKSQITICGEAVNTNLQTVEISDRFIDLGAVMVGNLKRYIVQIINRTPTQVNAFFDLWEKLPIHSRPKEKIESDIKVPEIPQPAKKEPKKAKKDKKKGKGSPKSGKGSSKSGKSKKTKKTKDTSKTSKGGESKSSKKSKKNAKGKKGKKGGKKKKEKVPSLSEIIEPILPPEKTILDYLKILPNDYIQMEPNKKYEIVLEFCPEKQLEDFSKQIFYETQDHVEPLCIVKGSCIGPQFSLANEYLSFANIVVGCRHSLSVLLKNTGDITGRFKWLLERKTDVFKINPEEGFIPPASELKIWFSFEPKTVECLLEVKAKCLIEGVNKSLELRLLGNSVKIPKPLATLNFTCPVRGKISQNVKIVNGSPNTWNIYPLVSSDQFCLPEEIVIKPQYEYYLEIIYCPKQMTSLEYHMAMLLLPLPEGQAMLYELIGTAQPPLPIHSREIEVQCKQNHTEVLSIENWLNVEQCFNVKTELTSPVTKQSLYKISGNDLIELPPNGTKDYKWGIYVINEIPLDFKVVFTNTETGEYMFYEISVKVLPGGPLETIKINTRVRELARAIIKLQNPIDIPVVFEVNIDVPVPNLTFDKLIPLGPYSTYDLEIQYYPLESDTINANIKATCAELGTFTYKLKITVDHPRSENVIKFKAELGDRASKSISFQNTSEAVSELFARFDHLDFSMEKVGLIPPGDTTRLIFNFEPYELGILQSKAILTSTTTGDYIYPLIGECILPNPKGPFLVKAGGSTSINFVNPFMDPKVFNFALDCDTFFLKGNSEIIKPKKNTKITVYMQPAKNLESILQKCSMTGKLIVTCEDDVIQWVYYIKGVM